MNRTFDVVIVGGGPAGACAAHELAKRGLCTVVLEVKTTPGVPVRCGELLRPASLCAPELIAHAVGYPINVCVIRGPDGAVFGFRTTGNAVVIRRDRFDAALLARAADAGAEIRLGHHVVDVAVTANGVRLEVRVGSRSDVLTARHVIASDGVGGRVARACGLFSALSPGRICVTASTRVRFPNTSVAEIMLDPAIAPGGYGWAFPIGDEVWNVGVGVNPRLSDNRSALYFLNELISWRFPGHADASVVFGGIPACKALPPVSAWCCTAVGDAGRIVNPVTGAGICLAINTGTEAGRRLWTADSYAQWVKRTYSSLISSSARVRATLDAATRGQIAAAIRAAASTTSKEPTSVSEAFARVAREIVHES